MSRWETKKQIDPSSGLRQTVHLVVYDFVSQYQKAFRYWLYFTHAVHWGREREGRESSFSTMEEQHENNLNYL